MVKQISADRLKRLSKGCCPVHGIGMTQIDIKDDRKTFVISCPRDDCNIVATTVEHDGNAVLMPEFLYLLD